MTTGQYGHYGALPHCNSSRDVAKDGKSFGNLAMVLAAEPIAGNRCRIERTIAVEQLA